MEMSPSLDAKMLADAKLKCVTRGICPLASRDWSPFEEYAHESTLPMHECTLYTHESTLSTHKSIHS